jgi:hypothetical protein
VPAPLRDADPVALARDVLHEMAEFGATRVLTEHRDAMLDNGLSRVGTRESRAQHPGDECFAARDGDHGTLRPMQSRSTDLDADQFSGVGSVIFERTIEAVIRVDCRDS